MIAVEFVECRWFGEVEIRPGEGLFIWTVHHGQTMLCMAEQNSSVLIPLVVAPGSMVGIQVSTNTNDETVGGPCDGRQVVFEW